MQNKSKDFLKKNHKEVVKAVNQIVKKIEAKEHGN